METLVDEVGETCNIALPDGLQMIYAERVETKMGRCEFSYQSVHAFPYIARRAGSSTSAVLRQPYSTVS